MNDSIGSSSASSTAVKTTAPLELPAGTVNLPEAKFELKSAPVTPSKVVPLELASVKDMSTIVFESETAEENSTTNLLWSLSRVLCHKPLVCK